MSKLVLHKVEGSPASYSVRILGDMLGLNYEINDIDIFKYENFAPEFMKKNPLGTAPLLEDGDFILSDSHAIMKYLLEQYGGAQRDALYPRDVRTRALVDQCLFFDTGVYFVRLRAVTAPTIFEGLKKPTDKQIANIEAAYNVVEAYLGNKKYIAADHLTIADLSVGTTTVAMQALLKLDEKKFPRIVQWLARLNENPFIKKYTGLGFEIVNNIVVKYWAENNKK